MADSGYNLDEQIGFLLRQANQRHLAVFARNIDQLTPTQFAAIAKLAQLGATSQNQLGRQTAMDAATIKGVIDRLVARDLVQTNADSEDKRRLVVDLTDQGRTLWAELETRGHDVSAETLQSLTPAEQALFLELLAKIT